MVIYNLHRALAEKGLLEKKITNFINSFNPVGTKKGSDDKVYETKTSIKDFENNVKSKYQQIKDLTHNYNALDKAIIESNSVTKVTIGEVEYTVADAIKRKSNIVFEQRLLERMMNDRTNAIVTINRKNKDMEDKLDEQTSKMEKSDKETWSNVYRKQNEWKIINPINIDKEIDELKNDIENFLTEVDYALSTSNAITTVEVDLK